ncbi:endonuclease III [Granulicella arctica]|uniref:Endonuclease III n=1 Tax=Granulicella arctica TaxID=940613 RepID=A0A7Y9PKH0_9BACT|nr:endonuclease III [Granulicella arctica]NYF80748.1 endonuclease-3 [Granulicella arctica]
MSATKAVKPVGTIKQIATGAKARAIAASEPVAPKKKPGKTKKPLAPERVAAILDALCKAYPNAVCALTHRSAWELTVATILSAQCTDVRVNLVTPSLFKTFPTPKAMAAASLPEIEELIRTTGFFRNKAKSIQGAAKCVVEDYGNKVPQTMEELLKLPGVARKTANVVLGSWFKIADGVVVDTHVLRISKRLELTENTTPEKVERDLIKVIPQDHWIDYSHEIIFHGRQLCVARKPRCVDCSLETLCNSSDKTWTSH